MTKPDPQDRSPQVSRDEPATVIDRRLYQGASPHSPSSEPVAANEGDEDNNVRADDAEAKDASDPKDAERKGAEPNDVEANDREENFLQASPDSNGPNATPLDVENQKTVISRQPPANSSWPGPSTPAELGSLLEGRQLGHFILEEFVGGGGMGAVFRAHDKQLGRTVAVKVLSRDQGADPETLRRFRNEAQSAARLDHENIARVFFVGEDDGWNFIVFEFIEGTNLRDLVDRQGVLPLDRAIAYTVQIAEALEHASARDVVHRDIKPSNILITEDGRAKLVDMGLARLHQMEAGHSDLTASGVTLGTFDYISPEQASDPRQADVRSDLYSLGCTLYFMLTGRPPFPHGTVLQKLLAHSGETPPDPRELRPEVPPELSRVVMRLLAKRPDQRFQTPRDFNGEMLVLTDKLGMADAVGTLDRPVEPLTITWKDRLMIWAAPALIILFVVLGLDFYWSNVYSGDASPPAFPTPRHVDDGAPLSVPETDGSNSQLNQDDGPGLPNNIDSTTTESEQDSSSEGESSPGAIDDNTSDTQSPADMPSALAPPEGSSESASDSSGTNSASREVTNPLPETMIEDEGPTPPAEPEGSDSTKQTDGSISSDAVRRIIVGDAAEIGDLGPDVRMFSTLESALASEDFVTHIDSIDTLEIHTQRLTSVSPLRLALPPGKHLTLRGVSSSSSVKPPVIRFAASHAQHPQRDYGMLEVTGGKLSLVNLQLEMRVEPDVGREHDISLIRLASGSIAHIEILRSVLTVDNPQYDGAPRVAFFDITTATKDTEHFQEMPRRLPVHITNSILRGDATVIRMRQSLPFNFVWNNGVLATPQRLLFAQGSAKPLDDTVRISLQNVTAFLGQGLCFLRDSKDQPYQIGLELDCTQCIISAGGSTLVEHDGVGDYDGYRRSLFVRGSHNAYAEVSNFWSVYVDGEQLPGWDWPAWHEKLKMGEGMPSRYESIRWLKSRTDVGNVPVRERGIDDYLLDPEADSGPIQVGAGFREESLPQIYRDPVGTGDDTPNLDHAT